MKIILGLIAGLVVASAAGASRAATSEEVSTAFGYAVTNYCAPFVLKRQPLSQWPAASRSDLSPASSDARKFVLAGPNDVVWEVKEAGGIVFIKEAVGGECVVSGYGPQVRPTFNAAGAHLVAPGLGFHALSGEAKPDQLVARFYKLDADGGVMIHLAGSDPGMAQHQSRFSNFTAFVARRPADELAAEGDMFAIPSEVSAAFSRATAYYCANAVIRGVMADQLPADSQATLTPFGPLLAQAYKLKPDEKGWLVSPGLGGVFLIQSPTECSVRGHGVPLKSTLDRSIGSVLTSAPFNMSQRPLTVPLAGATAYEYVMAGPPGPLNIRVIGADDPALTAPYRGRVSASVKR